MSIESSLQDLGLSDVETRVYLALVALGGSQASMVAKHIGIKRTTIYDVLTSLTHKGFANVYFRKNMRVYHAQKPQRVADLFEKKLQSFTNIIPQLQSLDTKQAEVLGVRLIQTKDELLRFYQTVPKEYAHQEHLVIGSSTWIEMDPEFLKRYRIERAKAGIQSRLLLTHDQRLVESKIRTPSRDVRFLPKECTFESTIDIFPDCVQILCPRSVSALGVGIEMPMMLDIFKAIFDLLWSLTPAEKKR